MNNTRSIHDRVTTAISLIDMQQQALIPLMYLPDKELFIAMLYAYGRRDKPVLDALNQLIPLDEAVTAVQPWENWTWEDLCQVATTASSEYMAIAEHANDPDLVARHDLRLKAIQHWTYYNNAADYTAITEYHRAKAMAFNIRDYELKNGNEGDVAEFVADLISWCTINNIDFDKVAAKAHQYIATSLAPTWGYITKAQKALLVEQIQRAENDGDIEHQLIIDILALNDMTRLEACQYAPDLGVGWDNLHITRWIVDNFTELTPVNPGEQIARWIVDNFTELTPINPGEQSA